MIANTTDTPQSYYLHHSPAVSYPYYNLIVEINNLRYAVCYDGLSVLNGAGTIMKVLEDWESLDVSLTVTNIRPEEISGFMKFTTVDVLQDHIKSLMCLEAL